MGLEKLLLDRDKIEEVFEEILWKMELMLDESRARLEMGITRKEDSVKAIEKGILIVREEYERIFEGQGAKNEEKSRF